MKFIETSLNGAYVIELEPTFDHRGFLARSWCAEEFARQGLASTFVQCNTSYNLHKGTLRGLHYQAAPYAEAKLIRCTRGSVFDVLVDLRKASETYLKWFSVELTQDNLKMLYVPEGMAHGFQTLQDNTELFYQMSQPYKAECARGVRWNDPQLNINWPLEKMILSERDQALPFCLECE